MTYYLHEVPGRLRIKLPELRRNDELADELQRELNSLYGVESTMVNTVTGSVIVHHDAEIIGSGSILAFLASEKYIDLSRAVSSEKHTEKILAHAGRAVSKALLGLALDRAFRGSPIGILTAFI